MRELLSLKQIFRALYTVDVGHELHSQATAREGVSAEKNKHSHFGRPLWKLSGRMRSSYEAAPKSVLISEGYPHWAKKSVFISGRWLVGQLI